jgi:hypothetical protein
MRLRQRDVAAALEHALAHAPAEKTGLLCRGAGGQPCPFGAKLRKDSKGYTCSRCRTQIAWNGLVPATRAREHLLALQARGLGLRTVADATDIPRSTIQALRDGVRHHLRAQAEAKILAVDELAAAEGARVSAKPSWRRVHHLLRLGYTRAQVAEGLGNERRLQLGRLRVRATTARKVEVLHREWVLEAQEATLLDNRCAGACGRSHDAQARRQLLAERGTTPWEEFLADWPCLYGDGQKGQARLQRDLAAMRRPEPRTPPSTSRSIQRLKRLAAE